MSNKMSSKVNVQKLDSGWDVIINDSIYENVTLSTFRIPESLKKGDTVILKTNLPEQLDSDSESITFQAILTTLEARIDGNYIYSYGEEAYEKGFPIDKAPENIEKFSLPLKEFRTAVNKLKVFCKNESCYTC